MVDTSRQIDISGETLQLGATAVTLSSNTGTATTHTVRVNTGNLTLATGGSQALTINMVGLVTASDLPFVQLTGFGTGTPNLDLYATASTDKVIVTAYNMSTTASASGAITFNLWVLKA